MCIIKFSLDIFVSERILSYTKTKPMVEAKALSMDFEGMVSEAERMIDRRNPEAIILAEKIKHEALETGKPRQYAQANYIMAFYNCIIANNYDSAIQLCEDVLIKVKVNEINEIGYKIYMTLGNAYQLKGEVFSAQLWYLKGLKQLEYKQELTAKERGFLASFYYNLSLVLSDTELKISAEEYLEKAIGIYESLGPTFSFKLSKSYGAYASIFERRKEYHTAIELMRKALRLDQQLNEPYSIALSKANLGILHIRIKDIERAFQYLSESLEYFERNKLNIEAAMVKMHYGEVLMKRGGQIEGMHYLFEAEEMFLRLDNKRELCSVYEMISRFSEEQGDFKLALQYHHKYTDSLKQFFDVEKTNALTRAKREFETEQKENEANLLRQKNEEIKHYVIKLESSNNELQQFAHVASHDLREPLRMITAYIGLLKKSLNQQLTAQQIEFIGFVSDASKRMDRLITDLLRLAKVDANPHKQAVQLTGAVEEIKQNLEMLIQEKKAAIIFSDLPEIMVDRTMILQLFQNIISNGIKYNQSERPLISIRHTVVDEILEISISDNGIGIPVHLRQKAFEIFNRLNVSDQYSGSGIGLAICKKIVESMEGEIMIESNPTGGTIFRMRFPTALLISQIPS